MKAPIIMLLLLLSGCGVGGEAAKKAFEVCEPHGGVRFLAGMAHTDTYEVVCNDGVEIKGTVP